jgi:hypothetical protein
LICPGNPDCVITSSGVNCATGCIVTSAGLSCPRGGKVLPNQRISGVREQGRTRETPPVKPKSEGDPKAEGKVSPTTVLRVAEARRDGLPFTGAPVLTWLVLGFALWAGGLLLRRTSTARTAFEVSTEPSALAVPAAASAHTVRPPSRWAFVLRGLALLACGMLLLRRTRR